MQLVDKIKKYVTSIPCEDLNKHHALLGDVLKGVLDTVKHQAVSVHKIIILLSLTVTRMIDWLLQGNKRQEKVIEELINEGCVMATEIMAFANLDLFKSDSLKSMVLFWFESFDIFYIYMLLLPWPNTPFATQMQPQSIHNSLQTAGVCTTTTTACCQQTTTLHACELGHWSRVLESAITCCVHGWIRSCYRHCGDKKQSQEWWDWSRHTTHTITHT